jgi:hypothetical protein
MVSQHIFKNFFTVLIKLKEFRMILIAFYNLSARIKLAIVGNPTIKGTGEINGREQQLHAEFIHPLSEHAEILRSCVGTV